MEFKNLRELVNYLTATQFSQALELVGSYYKLKSDAKSYLDKLDDELEVLIEQNDYKEIKLNNAIYNAFVKYLDLNELKIGGKK